jgi:hypothetical protein
MVACADNLNIDTPSRRLKSPGPVRPGAARGWWRRSAMPLEISGASLTRRVSDRDETRWLGGGPLAKCFGGSCRRRAGITASGRGRMWRTLRTPLDLTDGIPAEPERSLRIGGHGTLRACAAPLFRSRCPAKRLPGWRLSDRHCFLEETPVHWLQKSCPDSVHYLNVRGVDQAEQPMQTPKIIQ